MTEESTEVTTPVVDTQDTTEDRYEVETNIVSEQVEPKSEEPKQDTKVETKEEPAEEPEKKSINPRTLARKAEKERLIRENATMAEKLRQYEAKKPTDQQDEPKKWDGTSEPNIQDYDDVLEYNRDIAKFEAREAFREETSKLSKQQRMDSFEQKAEVLRAEKPDFDERMQALVQSGLVEQPIEDAVFASDMSAEVAYHLSQYPADLMQLRGYTKDMLPQAIKAIEAFIKQGGAQQEQPRVTKAQPPITPPGVTAKTDRSINSFSQEEIENMPLSEYNKLFNNKR